MMHELRGMRKPEIAQEERNQQREAMDTYILCTAFLTLQKKN